MHITEQLLYLTARITAHSESESSVGTGFFFSFEFDAERATFLVTNKHVVDGFASADVRFCLRGEDGSRQPASFTVDLADPFVVRHPDPSVDICAIPVGRFLEGVEKDTGGTYLYASEGLIPSQEELDDLLPIEEVVMVGYPSGLFDSHNECPIVRRGITATPANQAYEGLPTFLLDMACFEGSSGSPVLILDQGTYVTRKGIHLGNHRCYLLGILYATYRKGNSGTIEMVDAPTAARPVPVIRESINLGVAVNARCLLDLKDEIAKMFGL